MIIGRHGQVLLNEIGRTRSGLLVRWCVLSNRSSRRKSAPPCTRIASSGTAVSGEGTNGVGSSGARTRMRGLRGGECVRRLDSSRSIDHLMATLQATFPEANRVLRCRASLPISRVWGGRGPWRHINEHESNYVKLVHYRTRGRRSSV